MAVNIGQHSSKIESKGPKGSHFVDRGIILLFFSINGFVLLFVVF